MRFFSLVICLLPITAVASTPSRTVVPDLHVQTSDHAGGPSATASFPETTPPALELQKRGSANTCGVVSGATLTCADPEGYCVWDQSPGVLGCCQIDASGYADRSCILKTACVPYGRFVISYRSKALDPATLFWYETLVRISASTADWWSSSNAGTPFCHEVILSGFVTRPNGFIEPGTWSEVKCGTATRTSYGSIWTGSPTAAPTPDYDLLSQNIFLAKPQAVRFYPVISNIMGKVAPFVHGALPNKWPPSETKLWDPELFNHHKSEPLYAALAGQRSYTVEERIKDQPLPVDRSQNMPLNGDEEEPSVVFPSGPVTLDEDDKKLAISLFPYYWPRIKESLSRRSDLGGIEDEVPEVVIMAVVFQFIALNPVYFSLAHAIENYSGTVDVVTSTITVPAGPLFSSFTTVVEMSSIPGMTTTTPARNSDPAETGNDRTAGGAKRAGNLNRITLMVCLSLAIVVVLALPSFPVIL